MKKFIILVCISLTVFATSFASPIYGTFSCCPGNMNHLEVDSASSSGGTWTSSNTSIATVSPSSSYGCNVYGVSAGIAIITYTLGGSYVTASFTVNPAPTTITGTASVCSGSTSTLSDATAGGTWSSGETWIATIGSGSGVFTGVNAGTTEISYTLGSGCYVSTTITINATPTGYIYGSSPLCIGSTITFSETVTGGTWSSSDPSVATIGISSGIVTGVSAGTVYLSYTVTGICGVASKRDTITVSSTTVTGTISGPSSVEVGHAITLTESIFSGTWSSSNALVAGIDPSTGVVSGLSAGTATISYSVTGCGGPAVATTTITVTPFDGISGYVLFTGPSFYGPVKIWLITYNPSTLYLEAVDSSTVYCSSGASVYYEFPGIATDSFRVKATVSFDTSFATTGYVPTYHDSSFYWYNANVIYHTSGTSDVNKDINMAFGSVTPGPGFIGGNVTTGANKGTTDGVPVKNLLVFAVSTTTNKLVQQTYTDASGNYTFSGLPYGTYFVYPELLNYETIPYTGITLNTSGFIKTGASFIEHTLSKTITPVGTGVTNFALKTASVTAFPNPTTGKLNLAWNETANETGKLSIADITGREIYKTTLNMTEGRGMKQVDLSALTDGLYIIAIKSCNTNYISKIQVQH